MLRYTMFVRCCVWNRGPWSASLQHQLAQQAASFPCRLLLFVSKWHRKESIVRFLCCDRPYGGGASIWDLVRCSLDNVVLIGFYVRWLRSYSSSWRHLSTFPSGGIFPNFPFRVFPAGRNLLPVVSASCKSIVSVLTHSSIHRWRNEEIKKKKKKLPQFGSRAQQSCTSMMSMHHTYVQYLTRSISSLREQQVKRSATNSETHLQEVRSRTRNPLSMGLSYTKQQGSAATTPFTCVESPGAVVCATSIATRHKAAHAPQPTNCWSMMK